MLKKILLIFIIIILLLTVFFYFNGGIEFFTKYIQSENLSLSTISSIQLENKNSKIILKRDGFYNIFENKIDYYDYSGNIIKSDDFDSFIKDAYINNKKIIKTEDNLLYSLDDHELLKFDSENKKILNIVEDGYIFDINSGINDGKDYLYVYNSNEDLLGSFKFDKDKIIHVRNSFNSNSMLLATFNFDGSTLKSSITEYLTDNPYELWRTDFKNELVLFMEPVKDGIYLATDCNIYKLNNQGNVLWQYGGYSNLKDFKIIQNKIVIVEGNEGAKIHIITKDGKLINKIETNDSYSKINQYNDYIITSSSKYISYIKDNKCIILYNSVDVIKNIAIYGDMLRVNFQNQINSYKIAIK